MAVGAEAALQQTVFAALALQEGNDDAELHALAARIVASKAALSNASEAIQVHGGMGYTFEHDVHLYLKRAHVLDHLFGSRATHLDELADAGSGGLTRRAAIVGVGLADVAAGQISPYDLVADAARRALSEAGLQPQQVDGLASTGRE